MLFRHFFHEFRAAVSDTRRVAWIPGALALLTFLIWQAPWSGHPALAIAVENGTCRTLGAFFNDQWVHVGWLIPWFMLKYPSLHDSESLWRTAPAGKWAVFGSRLLWTFLATVAVPVGLAYFLCRKFLPCVAVDQSATVFWIQGALFCVGAFAALSFKGRRGLWFTGALALLWFVINLFGEDSVKWVLHRWILDWWKAGEWNPLEDEYMGISRTWPGIVPWVLIPGLMAFWIPFNIARPGKESRLWGWIVSVCLIALASQAVFFLTPYRTPDYPSETLPLLKLELQPKNSSPRRTNQVHLGSAETVLPADDLRFIPGSRGGMSGDWNSTDMLSGEWNCEKLSGRFSPQLDSSRMAITSFRGEGEDGKIPDERTYGFDEYVRPLRETLGVPGVKVWMARKVALWSDFSDNCKPVYEWADSDTFMRKPRKVAFSLGIPKLKTEIGGKEKPVMDAKVFAGKTIMMRAKVRLNHALPPKAVCRFPFSTGGVFITGSGETISILPGMADDRGFLMRRVDRAVPLEARPRITDRCLVALPDRPELLLFNAKKNQAVYLVPDSRWNLYKQSVTKPDDPDAPFDMNQYEQYSLPANSPKLSPEWFAAAEFVVLEYKDEPVTLPLELTLKVPAK